MAKSVLHINGTSYVTFEGLDVMYSREIAVVATSGEDMTIKMSAVKEWAVGEREYFLML